MMINTKGQKKRGYIYMDILFFIFVAFCFISRNLSQVVVNSVSENNNNNNKKVNYSKESFK